MVCTVKVIQMSKRCNQIEHHFYTIFTHLYALSEFELCRDIVLDELLSFVLTVVGGTLEVDAVAEVLFDEQNAPALLVLVPEGGQPSGVDKGAFLGEVVAQVGEDSALLVLHVAAYPKVLFESDFLVPPYVLVVADTVGATGDHLHQRIVPPFVIHHGGYCRSEAEQVDIEHTRQLIQRLDDVGNLVRVADDSRLSFLYEERLDDMNIIVKHHKVAEVPGHPISFRYQTNHIIGVRHYLAFGIILPIEVCLTLGHADDRIVHELFGENSVVPLVGGDDNFQIAHFLSPSSATRTSLTSITLLLLTLPVL